MALKRRLMLAVLLVIVTTVLALRDLTLDREQIRKSILEYRSKRSINTETHEFSPRLRVRRQAAFPSDDEDFDVFSGDDGVEPTPPYEDEETTTAETNLVIEWVWYRCKVNFLDSIVYSAELQDYQTDTFHSLSDKIMFGVEEYFSAALPGYQEATPLMFTQTPNGFVEVLIDVGSCSNIPEETIERTIRSLLRTGQIGDLAVSEDGLDVREVGRDASREECLPGAQVVPPTTTTQKPWRPEPTPPDPDVDTDTSVEVEPPTVPFRCRESQATCRNGQCIDRQRVCDGVRDCSDGSDEPTSCGNDDSNKCDPTEFLCVGTGICAQKMWRCDGDDDCGDGYDELSCPSANPGSKCRGIEFECVRDSICVPASYQCDGEDDCSDRSDEDGCSSPTIIRGPRKNVTVKEGELVVLECEAVGTPTPIVSWRLNWGNVGVPPRVSMSSSGGRGEITIKQARRSDQGAYTCEAINSGGSIFAVPDAVLIVEDGGDVEDQPPCPPGEYGMEKDSCRPCYCFGVTDQCEPLKKEYDEIGISFNTEDDIGYVELKPAESEGADPTPASEPINRNQILVKPAARELQLIDLSKRFLAAAHYWSLPAQFLGAKINSYGGTLKFSFSYNNSYNFEPRPTNYSDVIIEGANGKTLVYHDKSEHPEPTTKHTRVVGLEEDGWKTADGKNAEREDMLGVLNDIDKLLLRTVYDNSMLSTGIGDVRMTVAQRASSSGSGSTGKMAYDVEKCICPEGYEGLSCQYCASGWKRITVGPFIGRCQKITTDEEETCPDGYAGVNCTECDTGYERYRGVCLLVGSLRCDTAGTVEISGDECPCKTNVEGERCELCRQGYFNLDAENPSGCDECFCMGVSNQCSSSEMKRYKIVPSYGENEGFLITNVGSTRRLHDAIEIGRDFGRNLVRVDLGSQPHDVYYWVLPRVFTGNKISSYGGYFRYTIEYDHEDGATAISRIADVKIEGNDVTLEYKSGTRLLSGRPNSVNVQLNENYWTHTDGRYASRRDLLMVLADIDNFMVRATYATDMKYVTIYDISLEASADRDTGGREAVEVEKCRCPPGYEGTSCEDCSPGYHRSTRGSFLGTCVRCSCNGHSDTCDESTGQCLECKHNTAGDRCDRCADGFYGDPRLGTPNDCRPCPCPVLPSRSDRPRVASCVVDIDGLPTCDECPPGYEGRNCDRCSSGFELDELRACRKTGTSCQCDPNGSVDGTCGADLQCNCKEGVHGLKCDSCQPSYFYFSVENEGGGCLPCFCMGVTTQCEASQYAREKLSADFSQNFGGFALTNRQRSQSITNGFQVRSRGSVLTHPQMNTLSDDIYYWEFPSQYLGDKIVSYGGDLNYTVSYTPFSSGIIITEPDVIIVGNDIILVATLDGDVAPRTQTERSVTFREQFWRRADGQPASREHLLMALADLEYLLVRATYTSSMTETAIYDVFMETATANDFDGAYGTAYEVEHCTCPDGYEGLSCEDCSPGYTRSGDGYYLGLCKQCQCNGRAEDCDSESGECLDCQDNTVGPNCEECAPGFYTMSDDPADVYCSPCMCPGEGENSFSDTCEYQADTGNLLCTACKEGYVGTRCENCAEGYEGNPRISGGRCSRKGSPGGITQSPPVVTVSPSSLTVGEGKIAFLRCKVEPPVGVRVTWRRTGGSSGRPIPDSAVISDRDHSLTIRGFTRDDVGTYECVAQNQVGFDTDSAVVTLARRQPKMLVRVEEPTQRRLTTGSQVTFVCTAQSEMNAYIMYWSKKGGRLPPSRSTDFNGILHITDLTEEDTGIYICTGSNMHDIDHKEATLFVVQGSDGVRPTVTIEPVRQVIREGEEAHFRCLADGTPPISIQWRPSSGEKMPDEAKIIDGELYIPSVSMDNSAVFYCRASNSQGFAEATALLDVTAIGRPPRVTVVTPIRVFAKDGDDIEMECIATGLPRPLFSWRRLGNPRLPGNAIPRGGTLQLVKVKVSDDDTYVCTARNTFGEDSGTVIVNITSSHVIEKPICKTDPESLTVYVGADTSVTCRPQGDPLPTVTWVRSDGKRLPSNAKIVGNKLFIRNVTLANAGKYMCVATNIGGTTRSEMTITVESKSLPQVEILPTNRQVLEVGQSASFTCKPVAGHPVEVTWLRTDRKPFTARTIHNGGVITFTNVTQEEGGSYVCIANNVVGFREVATLLSVIQKPTITIEPTTNVYLRKKSSILLRCSADGIPVPNVVWKKVYMFGQRILLTRFKRHTNELLVRADEIDGSAQYLCVAMSAAGDAQKKVTVTIGEKETVILPKATVEKNTLSSIIGSMIKLRCEASGHPAPDLKWSKKGGQLPEGGTQENGVLTIPKTTEENGGVYICTATNAGGADSSESRLEIIVPPKLQLSPSASVLYIAAGHSETITCFAYEGTPPITYQFSKATGRMSENFDSSYGRLDVSSFNPTTDTGAYTCVGENEAGSSTVEVTLLKLEIPTVTVKSTDVTSMVGDSIELECESSNFDEISWSKIDGEIDNDRFSDANGVLRIKNGQLSDSGKYECAATNKAGSNTKTVTVTFQDMPSARLELSHDADKIREGENFKITCTATGTPLPTVTLTKDGSEILTAVDGVLTIESVKSSDSGTYACVASSNAGTAKDEVVIRVKEPFSLSIIPDIEVLEARSGEDVAISCVVTGTDLPVTWSRQDGKLPSTATVDGNVIQIDHLSSQDGGTYVCSSTPTGRKLEKSIRLIVHAFIPIFTQSPTSYIGLTVNQDFYRNFRITVSFRPNSNNGLILYSYGSAGDYMSLILIKGKIEFRYNVGSGDAVIVSRSTVQLGQWHTVTVSRHGKEGQLTMDNNDPVYGTSEGSFRALDLDSPLYLGGYPTDGPNLPEPLQFLGLDVGFYGCISQIIIGDESIDMGSSDLIEDRIGILRCKTCGSNSEDSPCEHDSACTESHSSIKGYTCDCSDEFVGPECQFRTEDICGDLDACGAFGSCTPDYERELGYRCECLPGYGGPKCENEILEPFLNGDTVVPGLDDEYGGIAPPEENEVTSSISGIAKIPETTSFSKGSYMELGVTHDNHKQFDVTLRVKVRSLDDGLILYNGGILTRRKRAVLDSDIFVSLAMLNKSLEFRYNCGSGIAILTSAQSVITVDQWHVVHANRANRKGILEVDGVVVAEGQSPKGGRRAELTGPLFLGGVKFWDRIPDQVSVTEGLEGCIEQVVVDGKYTSLHASVSSKNVESCDALETTPLVTEPITTQKTTSSAAPEEDDVFGPLFLNSGLPAGFSGSLAKFSGDSFISFPAETFSHDSAAEQFSLFFKTTDPDGLLLMQGRSGGDFMLLGLRDARLEYMFKLGSSQVKAMGSFPLADGQWHNATVVRRGSFAFMWIDELQWPVAVQGEGQPPDNINLGDLFIGGTPDVGMSTGDRYRAGFRGCIKDVKITPLDVTMAESVGATYIDDTDFESLQFGSNEGRKAMKKITKCRPDRTADIYI